MTHPNWTEIPVFIHGVTPSVNPAEDHQDNPITSYQTLLTLINKELIKVGKGPFTDAPIFTAWGWATEQGAGGMDSDLAQAQARLAQKAFPAEDSIADMNFIPLWMIRSVTRKLLRKLLFFGFADMFYYVSRDGEAAIRENVFSYIGSEIQKHCDVGRDNISLTFITHSGGTVIAHDLLYHLFRNDVPEDTLPVVKDILRPLVQSQKLRIRRFITMGSPLAPLMIRSNSLMKKIITDVLLDPADLGLKEADGLSKPRWINFWDKDDLASFPLAFLYTNNGMVKDEYVDVSDFVPTAHSSYWNSEDLARVIAECF